VRRASIVSVLAIAVLVLTAFASLASATPAKLAAEQYPASLGGSGEQTLSTVIGSVGCNTSLTGSAVQEVRTFDASVSGTCSAFGSPSAIKMNGCKFEFNPYWEKYSIGPKGCGPITVMLGTCAISIPPQTNLDASYATVKGSPTTLKVTSGATNLEYTTGKFACYGNNGVTSKSGQFLGSWAVTGKNGEGKADGLSLNEGVYASIFEAERYPANLVGSQDAANPNLMEMEAGKVSCSNATFSGELSSEMELFALSGTYSECEAFGFTEATVAMNGCKYSYTGTLTDEMDIDCPAGKSIAITAATCSVSIPAQAGLSSVGYSSTSVSAHDAIRITPSVGGLAYTVTKDGFFCPFKGTGARTNGTYTGSTIVHGEDANGLVNIRVNG
jgi:hypothetical protein